MRGTPTVGWRLSDNRNNLVGRCKLHSRCLILNREHSLDLFQSTDLNGSSASNDCYYEAKGWEEEGRGKDLICEQT